MDAVARLARGFSRLERLEFMDGSPVVEIAAKSALELEIGFYAKGRRRVGDRGGAISLQDLVRTLLGTGDAVVKACRAKSWVDADLDLLEDKVEVLRLVAADVRRTIDGP